jgi:WD40 repeat protein/predicted Ser/Thr protein kinase
VRTISSVIAEDASAATVCALERICDQFEVQWQSSVPPAIEDYLPPGTSGPWRASLLQELITLDVGYRRRLGERLTPAHYYERYPADAAVIDVAFGSCDVWERGHAGRPDNLPTIPGYTVLKELGRGGMGVVYKATAEQLNRFVALKMILSGDLASPEATARFLKEAEAIARLQHPQVVQIFRVGDYQRRPYLEMEYIEGGSLADRLVGRPWDPRTAARLVESLALAVHHAHLREIVHRDLKPANILLTADGTPKVTDFGLAKCLGTDVGLTRTDSIMGSPSYMAPEQAGGSVSQVGPAADVYSLGAILYELLTGRPPFRAATVLETLEAVRSAPPVSLCKIRPGLSIELETITLKCLEKDPRTRYPSAAALAADLRHFGNGEPIWARRIGIFARGAKWARRRPLIAALTVLSAASTLLLIIVLAISNVAISRQQRETSAALTRERLLREELGRANDRLAEEQKRTAEALRNKTDALAATSEDLQRERQASYLQRIALADAERLAGRPQRVDAVLAECPPDLRGWEWRYLKESSDREPTAFIGHTGEVWDAALSPDGRRLASASFDHTIKLWDAATGQLERTLFGHQERAYSVGFDDKGTRLVSASADRTAIVWDLASGKPLHVLRGHTDNVRCAVFSHDGHTILSGSWDGTIGVWDADGGRLIRPYHTGAGWVTRVAVSPDSRWAAVSGSSGRAEVWDHDSGSITERFDSKLGPILSVVFSPDGWRIATTNNAAGVGVVKIWDVLSRREVLSFKVSSGLIERVVFSPDGRRLATSGWDGTVRLWDAASGREVLVLRGHSDRVWGVNWSARGDALVSASADGKVLLWKAGPSGRDTGERSPQHSP